MSTDQLKPGYNIIEMDSLDDYSFPESKMGIIEFLRSIDRSLEIKEHLTILGLDSLLFTSYDSIEVCKVIRNVLSRARNDIPQGLIVVFPVEGELRNHNPRLVKSPHDISLIPLFGNRIEKESSVRAYSPFNIEPG